MPKVQLICKYCGKSFERYPSQVRKKRNGHTTVHVYCSVECSNASPLRRNLLSKALLEKQTVPELCISDENLGYLAGIIDGEGSFVMSARGERYTPQIAVASIDRVIVDTCQEMSGVGRCLYDCPHSGQPKPQWSPYHKWWVAMTAELKAFLPIIIPHLRLKHRQAKLMLEYADRRLSNAPIDERDHEIPRLIKSYNHRRL